MTLLNIIIGIICLLIGALLQSFYTAWKTKKDKKGLEIEQGGEIECEECDMEYLKEEWKTTIEIQMHFNDLIIRFRSIVLSVFLTGLGVVYGFSEKFGTDKNLLFVLILALVFWVCCFLLDNFYYQKLLIGAVKHAKKFDDNKFFRKKGLFGLTKRISLEVSDFRSKLLIWTFYLLPMIILGILVYLKLT
jgi:hypothetical protein